MQNLSTYKILTALCGSFILAGCPSDSSSTGESTASETSNSASDTDSNTVTDSDSVSVTVSTTMTTADSSTSDSASTTDPTDPSADSSTTDPTDASSSSTDPTSGSSSEGSSSSGGSSSTDPSGSSSSTDPSGSTGTTGEVPSDGYGDCANNPEDVACLADEICVNDGGPNAVCLEQGCTDASDCAIPATGDSVVTCLDVTGSGTNSCYLDCSMGETCPDGMFCDLGFVCIWAFEAPVGLCPDVDLGSDSPQSVDGDNTGLADDHVSGCGDGGGEDAMYQFTAPADGTYQFDTIGTGYDTILSVIDGCDGPELACDDDIGGGVLQSSLTVDLLDGQSVIIVVDGYSGEVGPFTLNISTL